MINRVLLLGAAAAVGDVAVVLLYVSMVDDVLDVALLLPSVAVAAAAVGSLFAIMMMINDYLYNLTNIQS